MKRHLSAIFAGDIVGYSRLMEADEAGIIARQKRHLEEAVKPAIARHDGRIVKLMGDGILIEFPSVVEAVACAVDLQTEMERRDADQPEDRRIRYRVGINLGDVFEDEGDVFGDGVNIAARLQEIADPGGICISGTAYDHLKANIPVTYKPLGEISVKNITQPVRVYKVIRTGSPQAIGPPAAARPPWPARPLAAMLAGAVLLLALVAGAGWWWVAVPRTAPQPQAAAAAVASLVTRSAALPDAGSPDRPSVAVLPFDNLGGGQDQDYFSDGMTEDLITDLSQVSGLFVIARNTVFTYKGRPVSIPQIGRELGVKFVLEGSVRRAGDKVRINAQLIDASTGGHVWAERFDRDMADVFAAQDDVVKRIVGALRVTLKTEEADRLSRADRIDPEAYDLMLRGLERLRRFSGETNIEAREYFERALAIEPDFARALADLALTHSLDAEQFWTADPERSLQMALDLGVEARRLDAGLAQVHFVLANAYRAAGQLEQSIAAAGRALDLDPSYADAYGALAFALNNAGRPHEALEAIRRAAELNPLRPFFYVALEGQAHYLLGEYRTAAELLEQVTRSNPQFPLGRQFLAATYVEMGRIDDADWQVAEAMTLSRHLTLEAIRSRPFYLDPQTQARYVEALRTAGLE